MMVAGLISLMVSMVIALFLEKRGKRSCKFEFLVMSFLVNYELKTKNCFLSPSDISLHRSNVRFFITKGPVRSDEPFVLPLL